MQMQKRRVLLVCSQHLFGESIETILRAAEDLEMIGPWSLDEHVSKRIPEVHPNVVVIADAGSHRRATADLTVSILEQCPEVPVICAQLSEQVYRIYSINTRPARGANLLETIRGLSAWEQAKSNRGSG